MKKLYTTPMTYYAEAYLCKRLNDISFNTSSVKDDDDVEFDSKKRGTDFSEDDDESSRTNLYSNYSKLW